LVAALLPLWAIGHAGPALSQALQLPTAVAPIAPGGVQTTAPTSGPTGARQPRAAAAAPIKPPSEQNVLDQTYRWNGEKGEMTLLKRGAGYGLRLTVEGFQTTNPTEGCAVSFGAEAVPVTAAGRPEGVSRYRLEAPICPIVFDVLEGAIFVHEPVDACVIAAAACRVQVNGIWGPDAAVLVGQVKPIEQARTRAEGALREGFRQLNTRVPDADKRGIAREQASFSSERAQVCRDFRREGAHGFCATKFTEARAIALRARLVALEGEKKFARKPKKTN
jgi:hypothetical protein